MGTLFEVYIVVAAFTFFTLQDDANPVIDQTTSIRTFPIEPAFKQKKPHWNRFIRLGATVPHTQRERQTDTEGETKVSTRTHFLIETHKIALRW